MEKREKTEIDGLKNNTEYEVKVKAISKERSKETIKSDIKTLIFKISIDDEGNPYNITKAVKLGTAYGREYWKKYDGNAIAFSCYCSGARFYLISTNENAAYGYCSYNPTYEEEVKKLEYNNKTWYWMEIPFGFVG